MSKDQKTTIAGLTSAAGSLLVMLLVGCQSTPMRPPHRSGPDYPYPSPVMLDPVTEAPPDVVLP